MTVNPVEKWHGLWWRVPIAAFFLYRAYRVFLSGLAVGGYAVIGYVLFAVAFLTAAAMVMAPVFAAYVAHSVFGWLPGMFYPERTSKRPPISYSPAEAQRMAGRTREALETYEAILKEHPGDGRAYLAMVDIAWQDLGDAHLANSYYRRARMAVADEAYLDEMRLAYEDLAPHLPEQERELPPETLGRGGGTRMAKQAQDPAWRRRIVE